MKPTKKRLDQCLVDQGLCQDLKEAQACLMSGEIFDSRGVRLDKPGLQVDETALLERRSREPAFKSRAGGKLEHGLSAFGVDVNGLTCLDIGASTGGFTDCLLKRGADLVIAVDVGYGLIDAQLRENPRVKVLERCNARYLTREQAFQGTEKDKIDGVFCDVSFISLTKVIAPLASTFPEAKIWVLLFKPQFEVASHELGQGGVVKNPASVTAAMEAFEKEMVLLGFAKKAGPESSPLPGKRKGNVEYLFYFSRN